MGLLALEIFTHAKYRLVDSLAELLIRLIVEGRKIGAPGCCDPRTVVNSLIEVTVRRSSSAQAAIAYVFLLLLAAVRWTGTTKSKSARSYSTWRLKSSGRSRKGSRVDSGHPDAGFVYFEEVSDEGVEIDVGIREVVKGQLLPIPEVLSQ